MQTAAHIAREGRLVGRGSEAVVHLDQDGRSVHKRFDRAPIAVARKKAAGEYSLLSEAAEQVQGHSRIHVPAPISLDQDSASFRMALATGTPLLQVLATMQPQSDEWTRLVHDIADGLRLLGPLQSDMSPDHILVDGQDGVTFLDFGNGASGLDGVQRGDSWDAFVELCAATVYECSRPSARRLSGALSGFGAFLNEVGNVLSRTQEAGVELDSTTLMERIREGASARVGSTGVMRRAWYAFRIPQVARLIAQTRGAATSSSRRSSESTIDPIILDTVRDVTLKHVHSFVWDFPGEDEGLSNGVHKVVDGLCASLAKRGLDVTVHAFGAHEATYVRNGYRVHVHEWSGFRIPSSLKAELKRNAQTSVLVLNGAFNTLNTRLAHVARRSSLRYVITPHMMFSDALMRVSRHKKWPFWLAFERLMFRKAEAITVYGLEQKEWFAAQGIHTPLIWSLNGACDPMQPARDRFTSDGPVRFHFFGRINEQTKGLDLLISAVSRISADNSTELSFTLQGPDTGDRDRLQSRIDGLGLTDVIRFEDPVTTPNPVLIMAEYDVCILPSRYEGFPTSLVEAMMAARPIVCTRVGALAPMLEQEGRAIVVDPTVDGIEQGIRDVIDLRDEWPSMGAGLRAFVSDRLDWDHIATQWHHDVGALFKDEVSHG